MVQNLAMNLGAAAVVVLIISALVFFWKMKSLPLIFKILGIFILINLGTEFFSRYLYSQKSNNLFLLHIYTLLEFLVWSFIYKALLAENKLLNKYFWVFISMISILIISNTMFLEPYTGFNSNAKSLVQIILIGYAISYFFSVFGKIDLSKSENQSLILINFAVLLYYSGSLFIFMFSKYLIISMKVPLAEQRGFWLFNALLNLVFQLLILISIWKAAFSKTKSLS